MLLVHLAMPRRWRCRAPVVATPGRGVPMLPCRQRLATFLRREEEVEEVRPTLLD